MSMPSFRDLSGLRFGKLTVVERAENTHGRTMWRCRCECDGESTVTGGNLSSGRTKSCGCAPRGPRTVRDLTGQIFGRLTVVEMAGKRGAARAWRCICECGRESEVISGDLNNGHTRSCGCRQGHARDLTGQRFGS